jgi:DNA-directed RNA polymerase subunit L
MEILIKGETHTIGNLLTSTIYRLDPSISLIKSEQKHYEIRVVKIIISHPTPMKIFTDAVKMLIKIFLSLKDQFA